MKIYAAIENDRGRRVGTGSNEHLDLDVFVGNTRLASFTVRRTDELPEGAGWGIYDENDNLIADMPDKPKEGWSECNHYQTDEAGLCLRCGYNTLGLTMGEIRKRQKHKAK